MKSGTLTAFSALALMASHGVHAAPKGRSLSAMSKLFAHKTLALMKKYPKISSSALGVLGALSAAGYAKYRMVGEKREKTDDEKDLIKNTSIVIENLTKNHYIDLNYNSFNRFVSRLEALKKLRFGEDDCWDLSQSVKILNQDIRSVKGQIAPLKVIFFVLIKFKAYLLSDLKEFNRKDIKRKLVDLIGALTKLLKEMRHGAMKWVEKILQRDGLASLTRPFEALANAVNNLPKDCANIENMFHFLEAVNKLINVKYLQDLALARDSLKYINNESLKEPANLLIEAIDKEIEKFKKE